MIIAPALAARAGLRAMLQDMGTVIQEAAGLEVVDQIPQDLDVLVLQEELDPKELQDLLDNLENPPALLWLTDSPVGSENLPSLPLHAWGILPLDCTEEELIAAAQALSLGMLVMFPDQLPSWEKTRAIDPSEDDPLINDLTERELQVLDLLADGMANKQIALALEISEHTVKFHVSSIYQKLLVNNRAEAVRVGLRRGLISL